MNQATPPTTTPRPTNRLKWFLIGGGLVIALLAGWWLWQGRSLATACVVGESGKIYGSPPEVKHAYAGESLAYRLRSDGQFVPIDGQQTAKTSDHEYSLKVAFDQDYLNPSFGAKLTGKITLLQDGTPVSSPPKDKQGKLIFPDLAIPVTLYGAVVNVSSSAIELPRTLFNWSTASRASGDWTSVPVFSHRTPYPITQIYAPGGVGKNQLNTPNWTIDLTRGEAEFELHYFGLRHSPYLQLVFGTPYFYQTEGISRYVRETDMNVAKTICFGDQARRQTVAVTSELSQQAKTDFYYDVQAFPTQARGNTTTRIKLEIISRTANGRINPNPFQRVEVNGWPLGQIELRSATGGRPGAGNIPDVPAAKLSARGKFVLTDPANPEIEQLMIKQSASNYVDSTAPSWSRVADPDLIYTDLIKGRATVYFDFDGQLDALKTPLVFMVQPTNFAIKAANAQGSVLSNRVEQNLQYPEKPATIIGEADNPRLNSPDPESGRAADFLYQTWQSGNDLRNTVYAVHPITVATEHANLWLAAFRRLLFWQLGLLGLGAALLWWLHKTNTKHEKAS